MTPYLLIAIAYLAGSIPVGVVLSKYYGVGDITKEGSGNIGATNVGRVVGKKAGIITLAGDILKGALPVLAARAMLPDASIFIALTALAAFMGHLYPVFNKFKGGKGVATALGVFIVISPLATLCAVLSFIIILSIWRFVSLGSIVAAGAMPAFAGMFNLPPSYIAVSLVIGGLVIYRHKDNIRRLLEGTESRFEKKKADSGNLEESDE